MTKVPPAPGEIVQAAIAYMDAYQAWRDEQAAVRERGKHASKVELREKEREQARRRHELAALCDRYKACTSPSVTRIDMLAI
jgi:hypothetical protein